jgi:O-antigen/teichoic acid export membrane protein
MMAEAPALEEQPGNARRDTLASVLAGFAGQAMILVSGVLAARILGAEGRGHLALFWLVALSLSQLGTLGLPLAAAYWIAKDPASARSITRSLLWPAGLQVVTLLALQAVALYLIVHNEDADVRTAAILTLGVVPGAIAYQYALAILQGQGRFGAFNFLRLIPPVLYSAGILALFLADSGDLPSLAAVWMAGYLLAGLAGARFAAAGLPQRNGVVPDRSEMLKFGLKGVLGSVTPVETLQVDQAVVGIFISPTALGLYVVGLAFTNLPRLVAQSIGIVAYPHVARQPDTDAAWRTMWKFFLLAVAACGLLVAALEATVGWLVPFFFDEEFADSVGLARVLLIAALLISVRRVLADGARGLGLPGLGTLAEVVGWVFVFPALAVLVPAFDELGAALAVTAAAALGLIVLVPALGLARRRGLQRAGIPARGAATSADPLVEGPEGSYG